MHLLVLLDPNADVRRSRARAKEIRAFLVKLWKRLRPISELSGGAPLTCMGGPRQKRGGPGLPAVTRLNISDEFGRLAI